MKIESSQWSLQFKQLQINPKKMSGLQRDLNPPPLVSAALLYHLSYEDPYIFTICCFCIAIFALVIIMLKEFIPFRLILRQSVFPFTG